MNTININKYGTVISDKTVGSNIYKDISNGVSNNSVITIDFTGVISFSTFCARQIFGEIFKNLGQEEFKKKVKLANANNSIKSVISEAFRQSTNS